MTDNFIRQECAHCGEFYEADMDAAPEYCALVCSRGCAEDFGLLPAMTEEEFIDARERQHGTYYKVNT